MIVEDSKIKYKYGTESLDEASSDLRSKGLPKKSYMIREIWLLALKAQG